jgi:hypothetical protein
LNEAPRRRRRVRTGDAPVDAPTADTAAGPAEDAVSVHTSAVADEAAIWVEPVEADTLPAERGLRGLVGGGSSQVSPTAALRARDASRPRPQDLARAEADLAIVRRNWAPRE